jgi:hypothetical protein
MSIEIKLDGAKLLHKALLNIILREGPIRDSLKLSEEELQKLRDIDRDLKDAIDITQLGTDQTDEWKTTTTKALQDKHWERVKAKCIDEIENE